MGILAALEERLKASGRQRRAPANGPVLEAADAQRLLFLVKGAQAAGLVFELEQWADRSDGSRPPKRRIRTAFTKIKAIRDQLTSEAPESGRRSSAAHVQALAAAENAYGRALYLTQKSTQQSTDDAAEAFNNAVALVPDFADAWVNFATLLIRRRPPDWESRADDASARAVELTPRSSKAHYLRGLFFEQTKDDDEAEKEYTAAGEDAKTTVKLAQIAERKGDFSTAAKRMRASLSFSSTPDYRAELYVEYVLRLEHPSESELDDAEQWARNLQEHGSNKRLCEVGGKLLGKIEDLRPGV
jgi:hypothetical protein